MRVYTLLILLVALRLPQLAAGDANEHRRMGDSAFVAALTADSIVRTVLTSHGLDEAVGIADGKGARNVVLTYGLLTAICADPSVEPMRLLRSLQSSIARWNGQLLDLEPWLLDGLRGADTLPRIAVQREARRHHVDPARSYEEQLHRIDESLARTLLPSVRDRDDHSRPLGAHSDTLNWDLPTTLPAELTAPAVYALLHARARALALHAATLRRRDDQRRFVLLALVTSAVADHYLQDLFASDHHLADCSPPDASILTLSDSALSAERAACMEFYRRVGAMFQFAHMPRAQVLYGSGSFDDPQVSRGVDATAVSVRDVFGDVMPYYSFVDGFIDVVRTRPMFADSYAHPLTHAPLPLQNESYDEARILRRSVVGPFVQAGATVLTVGRSVGYSLDASAGLVVDLTSFDLPRSRAAGYETVVAAIPSIQASYGFARDRWFALLRAGAAVQLFDALRVGLSAGPAITATDGSVPVFLDLGFMSKPLSYSIGMEFQLSIAITDASPYDLRLGVAWALY